MKVIDASSVGQFLIGEDKAKDLFIKILELYLEEKGQDIEIDFRNVLSIDPNFFKLLLFLVCESNHLSMDIWDSHFIFSGLFMKDIESLNAAASPLRSQADPKNIVQELKKAHEKRQKEIWGNDPNMKKTIDLFLDHMVQNMNNILKNK